MLENIRVEMKVLTTAFQLFPTRQTCYVERKDVKFLKIAHFEKILEIKNIYDLDKNFYGNSHCVNDFQASR